MDGLTRGPKPVNQMLVQVSKGMAAIHNEHQAHQGHPLLQIGAKEVFPLAADFFRGLGITIAGQIHQIFAFGQGEIIEVLGPPRGLGDKGQPGLIGQGIDSRRLARIGASGKGHLAGGVTRHIP